MKKVKREAQLSENNPERAEAGGEPRGMMTGKGNARIPCLSQEYCADLGQLDPFGFTDFCRGEGSRVVGDSP